MTYSFKKINKKEYQNWREESLIKYLWKSFSNGHSNWSVIEISNFSILDGKV